MCLQRKSLSICLPPSISGSEFERDGKREVVVRGGLSEKLLGEYPLRLGRLFGGEFFLTFVNIISYQGMKERWKECMESCAVTRSLLPNDLTGDKFMIDNTTNTDRKAFL